MQTLFVNPNFLLSGNNAVWKKYFADPHFYCKVRMVDANIDDAYCESTIKIIKI